MTSEERNKVIDECIAMLRAYDERAHKTAYVRYTLSRGKLPFVPKDTVGILVAGLERLKGRPPLRITVLDVTKPPEATESPE